MRRASLLGGFLLACNAATPAGRSDDAVKTAPVVAQPTPSTPQVSPPVPVAPDVTAQPPAQPSAPPVVADAAAVAGPRYREADIDAIKGALEPDRTLAHTPFVGPFGPSPQGTLVLRTDSGGHLDGFVEAEVGGVRKRLAMPPFSWSLNTVHAVMFEDVDGDGADEAIILVEAMPGAGPNAAEEFRAAHVVKWNGSEFVALSDVEQRIGAAETAAAVRKALKLPPAKPR